MKKAVQSFLQDEGWHVTVAWGRDRGIDIEAFKQGRHLVIEAKGDASSPQQQANYFLGALGDLAQRMADPQAIYALALPDNERFRGLVGRLPSLARDRLVRLVFFVARADGELNVQVDGDERVQGLLEI